MFKFSSKPCDDGDLLGAQGTSLGLFLVSPKAPSHVTYHILTLQNLNRINTASRIIFFRWHEENDSVTHSVSFKGKTWHKKGVGALRAIHSDFTSGSFSLLELIVRTVLGELCTRTYHFQWIYNEYLCWYILPPLGGHWITPSILDNPL